MVGSPCAADSRLDPTAARLDWPWNGRAGRKGGTSSSRGKRTPLRRASEPKESDIRYFIRDDDVGPLTSALESFAETFASRGLPVSYQIIPARLTEECADFLRSLHRQRPTLTDFGQHGLTHGMLLGAKLLNREFGPERTLTQQRNDIAEGLAILNRRLAPDIRITTFTPPQHKFDRHTVVAAAEAGHAVFSVSSYPSIRHQIAYALGRSLGMSSIRHHGISYHGRQRPEAPIKEISIAIDVDDGRRRKYGAAQIRPASGTAGRKSDVIGFMFHHALYDDPAGRAALSAIADELAGLGPDNFFTLSGLGAPGARSDPADRR